MLNAIKFIHLLCIVVWVGMIVFFTFIIAPGVFKVLPRELAGDLVANIFPKYWAIGYISGILGLVTLVAMSFIEKGFPAARILLLASMTAVTFYSGFSVSSRASELRIEIRATEDPVKKEALKGDFKRQHFKSAALNISVLILGFVFIYFTARNLRI